MVPLPLTPETRHPNCNGDHPSRQPRLGPYTEDQCHLCWLAVNEPERVARLKAGTSARASACTPPPESEWPRWAKALGNRRREGEAGVGDTLARLLGKTGKVFRAAYKKLLGADCGCGDRQARMNRLYPYPPAARHA